MPKGYLRTVLAEGTCQGYNVKNQENNHYRNSHRDTVAKNAHRQVYDKKDKKEFCLFVCLWSC